LGGACRQFDPGAGGSHKRRRGFVARPHASLHRWFDPRFDRLLRQWLPQANAQQLEEIEAINAELPFTAPPCPWASLRSLSRRPRGAPDGLLIEHRPMAPSPQIGKPWMTSCPSASSPWIRGLLPDRAGSRRW
jgi:hypothetical protein